MRGRRRGVRAIGAGMGVGEGEDRFGNSATRWSMSAEEGVFLRWGGLPSTRALAILEARVERPLMEGFRTSKGGVPEWSLGGGEGPLPLVRLGLGLFLAEDVVGMLPALLLLR